MLFHSDSCFLIGSSHAVCEDYASHGVSGDICWGIVSDGCSSAIGTDIGSRLIVKKTESIIRKRLNEGKSLFDFNFYDSLTSKIFLEEDGLIKIFDFLGIERSALLATLWIVIAEESKEGKFRFLCLGFGDGQLLLKGEKKSEIRYVEFTSGAPFYPMYVANGVSEKYLSEFGTQNIVGHIDVETGTICTYNALCVNPFVFYSDWSNDYNVAVVCSDGFRSYNQKDGDSDSLVFASKRLLDFKGFEGSFVQRRMKALERKDLPNKISHHDDISSAGIVMAVNDPFGDQNEQR